MRISDWSSDVGSSDLELLIRLEGAVIVGSLAPRDVRGGRRVAGTLGLLLREVGRGEQAAGVLVGDAPVDQVLGADRGNHVAAVGALAAVELLSGVRRRGELGDVLGQFARLPPPQIGRATFREWVCR